MKTEMQFLTEETQKIYAKFPFDKYAKRTILKAMERFAEQEAKEFGKWFMERDSGNFDFNELYKNFKNGKN